ncbi:MAG: glycosyltransferase [wastewater metagenome]|nr:glycosyltransferase [Candidatus Loosdrechtia aerotolerans]
MNILLLTLGSAGDVHPFIGLGIGLKCRGHCVTIVTSGYFKELIQNSGLGFIEHGSVEDFKRIIANPHIWSPRQGLEILLKEIFLPAIQPIGEIIERFDVKDTVVVSSSFMFGARIAHERLQVPFVTVLLQPAGLWSIYEPPVMASLPLPGWLPLFFKRLILSAADKVLDKMLAPGINRVRAGFGLPEVHHIFSRWMYSPQKILGLFPDWFAPYAHDWPENTQLTGFLSFDRSNNTAVSQKVMEFFRAGDPPVIVTPGTAMLHGGQFFRASLEACQLTGKRAVLLTRYREQLPRILPHGIVHFDYVPLSLILPYAAALIHHGGIGTAIQGLAAGIPQMIMPINYDQPDNAARLERLGVGASIPPNKYHGPRIAKKLVHLLSSPEVKRQCKYRAAKMDFDRALRDTCLAIEQVADGKCTNRSPSLR